MSTNPNMLDVIETSTRRFPGGNKLPSPAVTQGVRNKSFAFISIDRPEDTNSVANRKAIRAQAARNQHHREMPKKGKKYQGLQNQGRRFAGFSAATAMVFHMSTTGYIEIPNSFHALEPDQNPNVAHIGENVSIDDAKDATATRHTRERLSEDHSASNQGAEWWKLGVMKQEDQAYLSADSAKPTWKNDLEDSYNDYGRGPSRSRSLSPEYFVSPDNVYLDAGTVDPFQTLSIPWRPFMSSLIHHFFLFFTPAIFDGHHPRDKIRTLWWPMVLSEPALCSATMLMIASHRANQMASKVCTPEHLWLKALCLKNIRNAMPGDDRKITDGTIGAILTVAACEFLYAADYELYHLHMRAAKSAVDLRGGLAEMDPNSPLTLLLYGAGHDLVIFVGGTPYFEHPTDAIWHQFQHSAAFSPFATSAEVILPSGLAKLDSNKFVSSRQVDMIKIIIPMLGKSRSIDRGLLCQIEAQLFEWTGGWVNSTCLFHGFLEDDVVIQSDQCLRLGLLCLVYRIMFSVGMINSFYADRRCHILSVVATKDFSLLRNTVYGGLVFWYLILSRSSMDSFCQHDIESILLHATKHNVKDWCGMRVHMSQFLYTPGLCDVACKATWDCAARQLPSRKAAPQVVDNAQRMDSKSRYELVTAPAAFPNFFRDSGTVV